MIEVDDEEARLLYAVVLEKVQEHFSYTHASEVARINPTFDPFDQSRISNLVMTIERES